MGLETYRRKRDFARTPEPRGGRSRGGGAAPLQFVVQKHAARRLHYDVRLELEGVLLSWAVPKGPSLDPGQRRLAMRTEDHPLEYAAFEGVIPPGEYGGGTVLVWDRGVWRPDGDPRKGLAKGELVFRLEGEKLRGGWRLVRLAEREEEREAWLLIKRRDAAASRPGATSVTQAQPRSVVSGRDLDEVAGEPERVWRSNRGGARGGPETPGGEPAEAAGRVLGDPATLPGARRAELPEEPAPQLATPAAEAPSGTDWFHEVKLDGYRLLARVEGGAARLLTRRGQDWTGRFPRIAAAAAGLPCREALLDGEAVVLDARGVSGFQRLQKALAEGSDAPVLVAFDLLHLDGWDLTGAPLRARKELLRHLLAGAETGGALRLGDHLRGDGPRVLAAACGQGLEGLVSKRADAPYHPGRRARSWIKTKCFARQELAVVGFTDPSGSREGFGALLLGVPADGGWRLVGRVGTGFDDATLRDVRARLAPLERSGPAVVEPPRGAAARGVHWVEPRLVAEVTFAGWTDEGVVRHASFQGLREDVDPREVRIEEPVATPGGRKRRGVEPPRVGAVRITNPDRVIYPDVGATKLDLARYYERVAPSMVPHLAGRPLTLVRCPTGLPGDCFYQKRERPGLPDAVPRRPIPKDDGTTEPYLGVDDPAALLTLVQHGVVELHVWGSRIDRLDRPDRLVFDLDPHEEVSWAAVVAAARVLRARLAELDLEGFPLATGGKGLHVVLPLERRQDWATAKAFSGAVARGLARAYPEAFTANMAKRVRRGRIFIDYLRNDRESTAIAPFSARSRPGAPVALPLGWDELSDEGPPRASVLTVDRALAAADAWAGYDQVRQSLTKARLRDAGADRAR